MGRLRNPGATRRLCTGSVFRLGSAGLGPRRLLAIISSICNPQRLYPGCRAVRGQPSPWKASPLTHWMALGKSQGLAHSPLYCDALQRPGVSPEPLSGLGCGSASLCSSSPPLVVSKLWRSPSPLTGSPWLWVRLLSSTLPHPSILEATSVPLPRDLLVPLSTRISVKLESPWAAVSRLGPGWASLAPKLATRPELLWGLGRTQCSLMKCSTPSGQMAVSSAARAHGFLCCLASLSLLRNVSPPLWLLFSPDFFEQALLQCLSPSEMGSAPLSPLGRKCGNRVLRAWRRALARGTGSLVSFQEPGWAPWDRGLCCTALSPSYS